MTVRVPATSANLGPGFDVLGLALSLHAEVGVVGVDQMPDDARVVEPTHPAQVAFARAGGQGQVWVNNAIPMARGLGFSGAVRVGGVIAAEVQRLGGQWSRDRSEALLLGTELEGHADNVAPAVHGGIVIASERLVVPVNMAMDAVFVMWVPDFATSTNESRGRIGNTIALTDAVFNIAHAAMLVTAFQTGDTALLREATRDKIHQDIRLEASPACREALDAGLAAGAWCGWLSGSGPTVAMMTERESAERIAKALPPSGHVKVLELDIEGAVLV